MTFPELRARLYDISIVRDNEPSPVPRDEGRRIEMQPRRLVATTALRLWVGLSPCRGFDEAFIDALTPRFLPIRNVELVRPA